MYTGFKLQELFTGQLGVASKVVEFTAAQLGLSGSGLVFMMSAEAEINNFSLMAFFMCRQQWSDLVSPRWLVPRSVPLHVEPMSENLHFCFSEFSVGREPAKVWMGNTAPLPPPVLSALNTLWLEWLTSKSLTERREGTQPDLFSDCTLSINPVQNTHQRQLKWLLEKVVFPKYAGHS